MENTKTFTSFAGHRKLGSGDIRSVLIATKTALDNGESESILIFEDETGKQIDFNLEGSQDNVLAALAKHPLFVTENIQATAPRSGPGRPKLGVVCREVSLLPRHWQWLDQQKGGSSVTLRKLVEEARKRDQNTSSSLADMQEVTGRFMWSIAGNLAGFEEASRALYTGKLEQFDQIIQEWPVDIRDHLRRLLGKASSEKK